MPRAGGGSWQCQQLSREVGWRAEMKDSYVCICQLASGSDDCFPLLQQVHLSLSHGTLWVTLRVSNLTESQLSLEARRRHPAVSLSSAFQAPDHNT